MTGERAGDPVELDIAGIAVVLADVEAVVRRSRLLARWLTEIRSTADDAGALEVWQQLVDAPMVAGGDTDLAPYSG